MIKPPAWTTVRQLQVKITKLERDKEQLRLFLHELIESYWRVVNQNPTREVFEMKLAKEERHE